LHYPSEFSTAAKNRIEAAKIRAYVDFADGKRSARWNSNLGALFRQCVLQVFLGFAREACAFGKRDIGGWSIDEIDRKCLEFLRRLTIEVGYDMGFENVTSRYTGSIEDSTYRAFRASAEWQKYQDLLLAVAPDKTGPAAPRTKPGPKRDVETARQVAEILARVASSNWPDNLVDICEALDEQEVPMPRPWHMKGLRSWWDAAANHPDRAKKAIQHHLKNSRLP
jgi:hypothetical protein